ncbi:hypothetical protein [Aestuariivivens sediminis]|uniref:copper amine oxidase n=1 Tax=Aestuariivivens sediminis TaxID=2913557 RepID=UPI001F58F5AE|nr:hypothetical protein [Aestuariivivens sediminis]
MKMYAQKIQNLILSCFIVFNYLFAHSQNTQHPLDPVTWQEYWTVLDVLHSTNHLDSKTRFSHINLLPPEKSVVWDWSGNQKAPRAAYAIVHQEEKTYRAEVNLNTRSLDLWKELKGIQPTWLNEEFDKMLDKVKEDPQFKAAMKKRGYEDLTFIEGFFGPPGYFGKEEQKGRRIAHGTFVDVRYARNLWSRGISGLTVVVDMHTEDILRIVDEGVVPIATVNVDFDASSIPNVREIPGEMIISQPNGPGFKLDGYTVRWQKWKFHVRPDHRVGMIISTVTYQDGSDSRKILYEGHLSEIFVPYMDASFDWSHRNFIDAGEYTAGGLTKPLLPGLDAPDFAYYMDGLVLNDNGSPQPVPNMLAIFEREDGNPSWRHFSNDMEPESRVKRDLVVRSAAVLGNYDYIFDWIFQQDGSIKVLVGATGIAEAKATIQKNAASSVENDEPGDAYGRFVDPNIIAVNHDHYFSFRMDLDVDGEYNSLLLDRLQTRMLPESNPRRSIWVTNPKIAKSESEAKLKINLDKPTLWRVISRNRKNHVGYPTSYQLMPGKTGNTLLSADDYPRRRVGFINYHLWATPYDKNEKFAAGDFPTLSLPGQGLPSWTENDRSIEDTDIVLWYTVGMHHMVRAEDWPVMPVLWHSFELRPFDYFDRNPALDLPKK